MAVKVECDRCERIFKPDDVERLDYYGTGIGHYHSVFLCKDKCHKEFQKLFMLKLAVEGFDGG